MSDVSHGFASVPRHPRLPDVIAETLTEAIMGGRLAPGERLPSERELGEQFDVSRTVIREAVRSLAAKGLVSVTSGRGVEVAAVTAETVTGSFRLFLRGQRFFDYRKIHEVRCAVEVETAGLAAGRARPHDIDALTTLCNDLERHLANEDYQAAAASDFEFHRTLMAVADNELFLVMLDPISDILHEIRNRSYPKEGVGNDGLRAHRTILSAVALGDEAGSREAMLTHLVQAKSIWLNRGRLDGPLVGAEELGPGVTPAPGAEHVRVPQGMVEALGPPQGVGPHVDQAALDVGDMRDEPSS